MCFFLRVFSILQLQWHSRYVKYLVVGFQLMEHLSLRHKNFENLLPKLWVFNRNYLHENQAWDSGEISRLPGSFWINLCSNFAKPVHYRTKQFVTCSPSAFRELCTRSKFTRIKNFTHFLRRISQKDLDKKVWKVQLFRELRSQYHVMVFRSLNELKTSWQNENNNN